MEENYWCFVLSTGPRDRFPSRPDEFPPRQRPLHGIVDLMGFWIAGPFHYHEMGIVVLVEHLIVLCRAALPQPPRYSQVFGYRGLPFPEAPCS